VKNILVIGGGGYVGSQLVPRLVSEGFFVTVLDTFWYGTKHLRDSASIKLVEADMRNVDSVQSAVIGQDALIHLACISNDPSFDLDPKLGKSINLDSFLPIVKATNNSEIQRFIYASSSSVYGIKDEERVTEDLALEPLTDYSKFKMQCEELLLDNSREDLVSTVVRPATVCGFSSRQRFDLVVNILTANAIEKRIIKVFGGNQFRPNLHIEDMVDSYVNLLKADANLINREIFNVGGTNLTVRDIAEAIQSVIDPSIPIDFQDTNDLRSYRVDSSKILNKLGFMPNRSIDDAVMDLKLAFENNKFLNALENPMYTNILRMKELQLG
jgi:nucleoside-diphosphate-sugar epimerase